MERIYAVNFFIYLVSFSGMVETLSLRRSRIKIVRYGLFLDECDPVILPLTGALIQ